MPFARCREYADDGRPVKNGCLQKDSCKFVHPDQPSWPKAPRKQPLSGFGRGKGRGHSGPPNIARERTTSGTTTTSNSIPLGRGSGSKSGNALAGASTLGRSSWGDRGDWEQNTSRIERSSASKNNPLKDSHSDEDPGRDPSTGKDKGKGKAIELTCGSKAPEADEDDAASNASASNANSPKWGGASPRWGASSPKGFGASSSKETSTVWNAVESIDSAEKRDTTSLPSVDERRDSDAAVVTVKPKPDDIKILPAQNATNMDVDSPLTPIRSPSVPLSVSTKPLHAESSSFAEGKPMSNVPVSFQTSRSGSAVPLVPPEREARETRCLARVTFKEAKGIWNEYIELIRRCILAKLSLLEERALYKDYKIAQNSPVYVKAGQRGTYLLVENIRILKGQLDRREKEYRMTLGSLCAFEEGFDFPLYVLMNRKVDVQRMREEVVILRQYVREAQTAVENMRITANDIEHRAHTVNAPEAPSTAVVKDELQRSQTVSEPDTVNKKDEIEKQLVALKEKAVNLYDSLLDVRDKSDTSESIQNRVDVAKESLRNLLESGSEGFSKRMDKLDEDLASLGRDLDEIVSDVAGLFTSFKDAEIAAEVELAHLKEALEEDKQIFAVSEANVQACQNLLSESEENLETLRQELQTFEESQARVRKLPDDQPKPAAIPEEFLDQLVASLMPIVRERLYADVDVALRNMTNSTQEVVQEHNMKQVQALSTALAPVYAASGHVYAMLNSKQ